MQRTPPWPVAVLFALAVALLVTLVGPLLLFNPWLTSIQQARHDVPERLGATQADVDRVTATFLRDVFLDGEFDEPLHGDEPVLDDFERSHMSDVAGFVRLLVAIAALALLVALVAGTLLRHDRRRLGGLLLAAAATVGAIALILAVFFAVAFEPAFLAFHRLFFEEGTFLFGPDSDLIRFFPQGFWFDASLLAGASIMLSAAAVALVGWRLRRSAPD